MQPHVAKLVGYFGIRSANMYTYSASMCLNFATNGEGPLSMCPYKTGCRACHVTLPERSREQQLSAPRATQHKGVNQGS